MTHSDRPTQAHPPSRVARRRIVLVSEIYPPDLAGGGMTAAALAEGLAAHHDVKVIAGAPDHTAGGVAAPQRERCGGVEVVRCRTSGLGKNNLWTRSLRTAAMGATMTASLVQHVGPTDIVLVVAIPSPLSWAAVQAARLRGARVGLLIQDIFPEIAVPAGVLDPASPALRTLQQLWHPLYRQVDAISVLGRDMADKVRQLGGPHCAPVFVAPHEVNLQDVGPLRAGEQSLRRQFGIGEDRVVFLFAGNWGRVQGLDVIVQAMALLRDRPDVLALFVGAGARQAQLEQQVEALGLMNVMLQPMVGKELRRSLLATGDVGLVSYCPGMLGLAVAGKTPDLLAAGKPILAILDSQAETARLLAEEEVGWVVPPGDPVALALEMARLASRPELVQRAASRARDCAGRRFGRDQAVGQTLALVELLAGARRP